MKLKSFDIEDSRVRFIVSAPGAQDDLVVEGQLSIAGLPPFVEHAYWKTSGDEALAFASALHAKLVEIMNLIGQDAAQSATA
jgi:hypothetical protein